MSELVFEILNGNTTFIKWLIAFFSSSPEFVDYAIYRSFYLVPLLIAFVRNRADLRLMFLGNLSLGFVGIFILDFISTMQGIFVYTVSSIIYLLPTFIATIKNKCNLRAIFLCNLLFGITGISWFVIFIWAIVAPENKPPKKDDGKLCKHCNELIRPSATVCHHCHKEQPKP